MSAERIKTTNDSETWKRIDGTRVDYVKITFDDDLDAVVVFGSDHKGPWVSDGDRYDSFEVARRAWGLPDVK